MDLDRAKELMAAAQEIGAHVSKAGDLSEAVADQVLKREIKLELGDAMIKIYSLLMAPVIREYPELDPDSPADVEAFRSGNQS